MNDLPIKKSYKILIISIISVISLIVVISAVLSLFYENAMVRYMKNYLDDHLLTQLSMNKIQFRVFRGFPKATIEISDVTLLSGKNFSPHDFGNSYADTLLEARNILLQFDLLKILRKEYDLKKIVIRDGKINILYDNKKRNNLTIWKKPQGDTLRTYSINLQRIEFDHVLFRAVSVKDQLNIFAFSNKTSFKGSLNEKLLTGALKGNLLIYHFQIKNKNYLTNASSQVDMNLAYRENHIRVPKGKIKLNKAIANFKGFYEGGNENFIDLKVTIPDFGLEELMSVLPLGINLQKGKYGFNGGGRLDASIKGSLSKSNRLEILSSFELDNCQAKNTKSHTSIDKIYLKGSLSGNSAETFHLSLDSINARLGSGDIHGNFTMDHWDARMIHSSLNAKIDLNALRNFLSLDTIKNIKGTVNAHIMLHGYLQHFKATSLSSYYDIIEKATFEFHGAGIEMENSSYAFSGINGVAALGNALRLDSLRLKVNETEMIVSGNIRNLEDYFVYKKGLKANLEISTDHLDITPYLRKNSSPAKKVKNKKYAVLPVGIYVNTFMKMASFTAGKFNASDLTVNMSGYKDSLYLRDFSLRFPDGSIKGNGLITRDAKHSLSVTCNAQPQKINIQQLFYAFNNFTQHFILDKNLRGQLAGNISFYATWDSTLKFIPESMKAQGNFEISNGELVQFEPMLKLSKYIDVEELRHIRFKTLKNAVFISDRIITIPEMAINSSAFNISISGNHSFNNVFDYRIKVLLSEVLFKKTRKKKEIDEFLVEENIQDQTTIPLIVAGTPSNYDVRFDKKKAFGLTRSKIKNDNKSGSVNTGDNIAPSGNYQIEWEEPEKQQTKTPATEDENSNNKDFVIEWEE